jgi:UDP-glucose 4-epimerase
VPSARIVDIAADVLIGSRSMQNILIGVRPGKKIHEILISEEEVPRTIRRGEYYAISPVLPELNKSENIVPSLKREYFLSDEMMDVNEKRILLEK